jgi:hypothetical protein
MIFDDDLQRLSNDSELGEKAADEIAALRARVAELERVGNRGCFVLMEMMQAYERRVLSDCKTEDDIKARPWECAEYLKAADYLRKVWRSTPEKQP